MDYAKLSNNDEWVYDDLYKTAWEYHFQRAVISDDILEYYKEHFA